jgi:hypothetical protein
MEEIGKFVSFSNFGIRVKATRSPATAAGGKIPRGKRLAAGRRIYSMILAMSL